MTKNQHPEDRGVPVTVPVVVVLPPRTLLLDVAGPIEVLRKTNLLQNRLRFTVTYVAAAETVASSIGLPLTGIAPLPDCLPDDAFIIVAGATDEVMGSNDRSPAEDEADAMATVDWLRRTVRPCHLIVSICSGALLAARAGLLDGRECTTHHGCVAELARLAPSARILENRLYVEDGRCLTSAGITAGIDLMLHTVAQMVGPAVAVAVARYLVVYLRRGGADPQLSPWLEGRNHIHPAIHRVQDAIIAEPTRDWPLKDLARIACLSPRHLSRLFNDQAEVSIPDYINRVRIALAHDLIERTSLDMEQVAERAGFSSPRQLRRVWGGFHDRPPSALRKIRAETRQK
ncbi:helix-turn-helix domain-containing protein [Telmatospirillum sp.]|uniref:GlxA family transcriptional regulator n=1 Tax=Telmatospirillum sp. TaxID=2079197 RepID=UPI00283C8482|nr:helix-turn-helix domain-containing protein [Telmatospirillum sp.]MDR3437476.1 helix-turn-helix domain-containing protein [Telmatospirillum sp.]